MPLEGITQPVARISAAIIAVGGFFSIIATSIMGTQLTGESLTIATTIVGGAIGFLFGNRTQGA